MKSTKKIAVALAAALFAASLFAFGACAFGKTDPGRLLSKEETEAEFSCGELTALTALSGYNILSVDSLGLAVVQKEDEYALYNLLSEKFVESSSVAYPLQKICDGMYYVPSDGDEYTIYHKDGNVVCADGKIENGYFTSPLGVRIYINVRGELTEEKNPLIPILTYEQANYALQLENYYLTANGNYAFYVFDETGKFRDSFDVFDAFEVGVDDEIQSFWTVKDTLFLQTVCVLPADSKSYDIFYDGNKLELNTFGYDVDDKKSKELIAFDFMVTGTVDVYDEYAVLCGYDVNDRECSREVLQTFGEDGNVYVDLQKLLPNTVSFATEGGHVYLTNYAETAVYYDGNKKYEGAIYSQMNGYVRGCGYYADGQNLYIYNNNGELSLTVTDYYTYGATPDGKIYYVRESLDEINQGYETVYTLYKGYETVYTLYIFDGKVDSHKKSDTSEPKPVQIGQTSATIGRIQSGFYIEQSGENETVYGLFGESPQIPLLSGADSGSVNIRIFTVDETDYALLEYSKTDKKQYSLLTMTNVYKD